MSEEMHLDLCVQSTNHLFETLLSIKENVRILEVFLNSGLTTVTTDEYLIKESKRPHGLEQRFYQLAGENERHLNCCCMCRFRQIGAERENINRSTSRASAATVSLSSNHSSLRKSRPTTLIPRLNKTASLRREAILQKREQQNTYKKQ